MMRLVVVYKDTQKKIMKEIIWPWTSHVSEKVAFIFPDHLLHTNLVGNHRVVKLPSLDVKNQDRRS